MEPITQQSLELDRADAYEQNTDVKALQEQEAKLLKDICTFKDALAFAQSDLVEIRRKLRVINKKNGTHKKINNIIYEYVQKNPGSRRVDIVKHLESQGAATSLTGVNNCKERGVIVENLDGTYSPGTLVTKLPWGSGISLIMDYAKNNQWFEVSGCFEYVISKGLKFSRSQIQATFTDNHYKDKFDVDRTGKYLKFRLKDQYRNT